MARQCNCKAQQHTHTVPFPLDPCLSLKFSSAFLSSHWVPLILLLANAYLATVAHHCLLAVLSCSQLGLSMLASQCHFAAQFKFTTILMTVNRTVQSSASYCHYSFQLLVLLSAGCSFVFTTANQAHSSLLVSQCQCSVKVQLNFPCLLIPDALFCTSHCSHNQSSGVGT